MATDAKKANVESISDQPNKSMLKKIQAAKDENTENKVGLSFAICGIFLGTLGCKIISAIFSLIPIAMIYLGAKNLHNCTINSFIPIYLLVQGICTILDQLLIFCQCRSSAVEKERSKVSLIGRLFDIFVVVWFIAGSVIVYKTYEPNYNVALGEYCDKTTYLFAFWTITMVYAFVGILIFACCCTLLIIGCLTVGAAEPST